MTNIEREEEITTKFESFKHLFKVFNNSRSSKYLDQMLEGKKGNVRNRQSASKGWDRQSQREQVQQLQERTSQAITEILNNCLNNFTQKNQPK